MPLSLLRLSVPDYSQICEKQASKKSKESFQNDLKNANNGNYIEKCLVVIKQSKFLGNIDFSADTLPPDARSRSGWLNHTWTVTIFKLKKCLD